MEAHPIKGQLEEIIAQLDPKLKPLDPSYDATMFLICAKLIGCDPDEISRALAMDSSFAHSLAHRARKSRLWIADTMDENRWDGEGGDTQFWMDVSVLVGDMTTGGDGLYSLTDTGKSRVERMLRDAK